MPRLLVWVARIAGVLGLLITALAIVTRLTGSWYTGGVQIATLLQLGIAAMVAGCLAYLALIAERSTASPGD